MKNEKPIKRRVRGSTIMSSLQCPECGKRIKITQSVRLSKRTFWSRYFP